MKKLAIKKVALSLFLAGYAASSAYALGPVTTQNSIVGNAPVIWSKGTYVTDPITNGPVERSLTLRISDTIAGTTSLGRNVKAKVGNYIHIFYDLKDEDGDLDENSKVAGTLKVWVKTANNTSWTEITDITPVADNSGEAGHLYFQISSSMAGATKIGFKLEEITSYGAPRENDWLWVSDIWSNEVPGHGPNPTDPGTDDHGPGDKDPDIPVGPIEHPGATMLGIFKYNSTGSVDLAHNLTDSSSTEEIKYGNKLAAVVWLKANTTSTSTTPNFTTGTGGDTNQSASYAFTWSLEGNNSAAIPSTETAQSAVITETLTAVAAGDPDASPDGYSVLRLGDPAGGKHNAVYSSLNGGSGYKAGIQGFKITVTAN